MLKKLRIIALIALGGGMVFQTASCASMLAPLMLQLATSLITSAISGSLVGT